jgi:hypothetical protein
MPLEYKCTEPDCFCEAQRIIDVQRDVNNVEPIQSRVNRGWESNPERFLT